MKFLLLLFLFALGACKNGGKIEIDTDSLKAAVDSTAQKLKDSVEAKGERTLEAVRQKLNDRARKRDSVQRQ